MTTTSVKVLRIGTRVIYQSLEFRDYHRNGKEATVVKYGPQMPQGGILHYIKFKDDGAEAGVVMEEIAPIK